MDSLKDFLELLVSERDQGLVRIPRIPNMLRGPSVIECD
jgi:hypothetical protein